MSHLSQGLESRHQRRGKMSRNYKTLLTHRQQHLQQVYPETKRLQVSQVQQGMRQQKNHAHLKQNI
jgi:hypothetical protein